LMEHPEAKITLNINGTLTEQLHDYGYDDLIGLKLIFKDDYNSIVYPATIIYINTYNQYDDYPGDLNIDWIYDTHIKIYGDLETTLRN